MHRLFALVCVLVVVCETGCCGARRRYSNCVPDACGTCDEMTCSPGCGCGGRGGRVHRHRRTPLFGRGSGGGFWGGFGDECCDVGCDGGCGVPMDGMPYSSGCSCGGGHVMEGQSFSTTTMAPGAPTAVPQQQQVYSPAAVPPAPPMEPVPAPAPGKIEPMSAEYFHPQATLVPPGASPTSLQAPQAMPMPEIPAAVQQAPPVLQVPAQGTIVPASSVMSSPAPVHMTAPATMPQAQPAAAQPLLWVPSGVQQ